jgi:hypothetical protein
MRFLFVFFALSKRSLSARFVLAFNDFALRPLRPLCIIFVLFILYFALHPLCVLPALRPCFLSKLFDPFRSLSLQFPSAFRSPFVPFYFVLALRPVSSLFALASFHSPISLSLLQFPRLPFSKLRNIPLTLLFHSLFAPLTLSTSQHHYTSPISARLLSRSLAIFTSTIPLTYEPSSPLSLLFPFSICPSYSLHLTTPLHLTHQCKVALSLSRNFHVYHSLNL